MPLQHDDEGGFSWVGPALFTSNAICPQMLPKIFNELMVAGMNIITLN